MFSRINRAKFLFHLTSTKSSEVKDDPVLLAFATYRAQVRWDQENINKISTIIPVC